MMYLYGYGNDWFWHGLTGPAFMAVFWVAAIYVVIRLMQKNGSDKDKGGNGNKALEILKERYAKGEISKDEFEKMKKDIT